MVGGSLSQSLMRKHSQPARALALASGVSRTMSNPVSDAMIAQVGTISAHNDSTIGTIIAEAMEKVGKDGISFSLSEQMTANCASPVVMHTISAL